ncbi:probable cytochrome P450 6a14 [Agrilus planipennis]|uniref:Probable cytochrome P450 6a14 n=1 Tax=Agrilus planipennis TaxID=224129 RepID=A0A1W4W558_AGRPL|nr:probable cytochrome P450 6a14 [Agrilus planipennis]
MIVLTFLATFLAIGLVSFVIYLKWSFTYWIRRNVFTFPTSLPFGNAKDQFLQRASIAKATVDIYREVKARGLRYGGLHFMFQPIFVPTDPILLRQMLSVDFQHFTDHVDYVNEYDDPLTGNLFTLRGAKWKAMRSKMASFFSSGKMKLMFQTMVDCTKELPNVLDAAILKKEAVDVKEIFSRYTIDIISSVIFGIEGNCLKDSDSDFRKFGKLAVAPTGLDAFKVFLIQIIPNIMETLRVTVTSKDVEYFFMNIVKQTIAFRDANNVDRKDFMQLFMKLRDEDIKATTKTDNNESRDGETVYYQCGLTVNEIAAQAFIFYVAGFETSATTLQYLLYELTENQDIQDKVREEIEQVLGKHEKKITYEAIQEMTYLDKCIYETLRKYPPVPAVTRRCTKEYKVPDSDLTLEKGTVAMLPIYGIHHDPDYYPDPQIFEPERFSEENKSVRPPMTFLAFGEGPRMCIGLRLGILQAKVGLVAVLKDYKFTLNSRTITPLQFDPTQFILAPVGGIWTDVEKL